ncbi:MAG TPA: hypothetical protein VKI19_10495 [Acidimicrobiales bacterium]|nr:hypothetical protein [Acidimicrobiales bacterium]
MGVYEECRHYLRRSTPTGELVQRCRVSANGEDPFSCPEGCLFMEERALSGAGWTQAPVQRMSNTADGLAALPPARKKKPRRKR